MDAGQKVVLVDGNSRRRAAISHSLSGTGLHIEPFESAAEMAHRWPEGTVMLAADDDNTVGELLAAMGSAGRWLPMIVYAEAPSIPRVVRAIVSGASDYLCWPFGADDLGTAIDRALGGNSGSSSARLREAMARSRVQKLTRREREVLAGVANGLSNRRIGEALAISPRTVEIHRANMLHKIGAKHTSEAIRVAIEASLVA